jgi:hypothetical protein
LFALVSAGSVVSGQQPERIADFNTHGWFSYDGDHPFAERWGVHFDAQWRRHNLVTAWQQYQLRPGINFSPNDSVMLTLGYAFTKSYPYGDFPAARGFPEHRMYQQVLLRHRAGRLRMNHRYRLEQRWIGEVVPEGEEERVVNWRYQNRFRYRVKASIPLKPGNGGLGLYLPVYDEILVNFGPNFGANIFDQNRAFIGLGYDFGDAGQLEVGFMNQLIAQRNGRVLEYNNTLVVTFSSTLPLRKTR